MKTLKLLAGGLVALLLVLQFAPAQAAVQIDVDPGAYLGKWSIQGQTGLLTGAKTLTVPDGNHTVTIGFLGNFTINVAADGAITSFNTDAATGGPAILTFNTTSIIVDPSNYLGKWDFFRAVALTSGVQTVVIVPNLNYSVTVHHASNLC